MAPNDSTNSFFSTQPARRAGSGALIRDTSGQVLLVEPNYKPNWEIPGGIVERGEEPRSACYRECLEELGLSLNIGRLLTLTHQTDPLPMGDSIMFVYDGGVLEDTSRIQLQNTELLSYRFVRPKDLEKYTIARLAHRIRAAIMASEQGTTIEMVNGKVIE